MLLYYITDRTQFPGNETARRVALLWKIADAASCGVDFIQLRETDLPTAELQKLVELALRAIRENSQQTLLLINSRTDVAIACGADGVHLRSNDIAPSEVRRIWNQANGRAPVISVAAHSADEVKRAAEDGAGLALLAPVFGKKGAPEIRAAGLDGLQRACQQGIPVLALGGVTRQNAQMCIEAGAAGVAGIRLFQEDDVERVVSELRGLSAPGLGK